MPRKVSEIISDVFIRLSANSFEAASKTLDKSLKDIRNSISEKTVDIFSGYRKIFSGSNPPGQLILPENLKEFSMYTLSLTKSRAFKGEISSAITMFDQC